MRLRSCRVTWVSENSDFSPRNDVTPRLFMESFDVPIFFGLLFRIWDLFQSRLKTTLSEQDFEYFPPNQNIGPRIFHLGRLLWGGWQFRIFYGYPFTDIVGVSHLDRAPYPVMTDTIIMRIAQFRTGRIFAQYIAHVMKAAISMRRPTDWLTPEVRSVARGYRILTTYPSNSKNTAWRMTIYGSSKRTICARISARRPFSRSYFSCGPFLKPFGCEGRAISPA